MPTEQLTLTLRTLAEVAPMEQVRIERIVFDFVRSRCAESQLHDGTVVTCLAATRSQLLLHREDGRSIVLDRFLARFIQVDDALPPARAARRVA